MEEEVGPARVGVCLPGRKAAGSRSGSFPEKLLGDLSWCLAAPLRPLEHAPPSVVGSQPGDRTAESVEMPGDTRESRCCPPQDTVLRECPPPSQGTVPASRRPESQGWGDTRFQDAWADRSQPPPWGQGPQEAVVGKAPAETPRVFQVVIATAPSASPPTSSGTCGTSTTRRSPSSATCATAASAADHLDRHLKKHEHEHARVGGSERRARGAWRMG